LKYTGDQNYMMKVFFAQEETTNFKRNYMVNPNNIFYETTMSIENKSDITLGFFKDGKFYFHSCQVGKGIIPNEIRAHILEHLIGMKYLTIREVLEKAGVEIVDSPDEDTVSLNTRGELIEFFS